MRSLIDGDILLYEIGFASQKTTTVAGETIVEPIDWELCKQSFDNRIATIQGEVEATEPPLIFFEGNVHVLKQVNRLRKLTKEAPIESKPNFRDKIAITKEYKGNRKAPKPFHYRNLIAHALATYDCHIVSEGMETDDALCIYATQATRRGEDVIICSRDKDVRQYEGNHYSWECGKQNAIGPLKVEGLGTLVNKNEGKYDSRTNKPLPLKVFGTGKKFFYYQLLTGDSVDNIIGVMGRGPAFSYNLLKDLDNERKLYEYVAEVYVKTWGDEWEAKMQEMIDLLWIVKDVDEEGNLIKWQKPPLEQKGGICNG